MKGGGEEKERRGRGQRKRTDKEEGKKKKGQSGGERRGGEGGHEDGLRQVRRVNGVEGVSECAAKNVDTSACILFEVGRKH